MTCWTGRMRGCAKAGPGVMCEGRKDYSANSDVWDVWWKWHDIKPAHMDIYRKACLRAFSVSRFGFTRLGSLRGTRSCV